MDMSSLRYRVLMEPRGFIRVLEVILAIVCFATTGGYSGSAQYSITCTNSQPPVYIDAPITYPFQLSANEIRFSNCSGTKLTTRMEGDLSPSAQWFVFVGVTAFLYSLAAIIFYVVFDASVRLTHERFVTIGDLGVTVLYTFFWLTAASAWAWGLGQVKLWSSADRFWKNSPFPDICNDLQSPTSPCGPVRSADFSPLTASVAFAFLNFFLWGCNVWFVYKESPYHQEPAKENTNPTFPSNSDAPPPNNM